MIKVEQTIITIHT